MMLQWETLCRQGVFRSCQMFGRKLSSMRDEEPTLGKKKTLQERCKKWVMLGL